MQQADHLVELSIIVPTYNAGSLAESSARALYAYFSDLGYEFEIVIVDDGSDVGTRPTASLLPPRTRLLQLDENYGKGCAVRTGLLAARGSCRIFTDVDLPYGLDSIAGARRAIVDDGADFAYGDRSLPESSREAHPSWRRRLSSALFRSAVSSIVGLPPTDTQCGLKAFRGDVADAIGPLLRTDHFAFDVEIFRCAIENGLRATPIPVRLVNEDVSTVRLLRDSVTMLRDLVTIRSRARRGEYRSEAIRSRPKVLNRSEPRSVAL
jgi:dolichyl-phosphate beta-glucosyltransferase